MTDASSLDGQTALVTGGAKRIGEAIVRTLAKHGAGVVIHFSTSGDEAQALADEIMSQGGQAWTLHGDLSDEAATADLISRAQDIAGPIAMLINSASIFPSSNLTSFSPEELAQCIQVNAMAPLQLARDFVKHKAARHIVNLLDCRIVDYDREHTAYHLSKRMLSTLTRDMAVEFAPAVQVNAVAPGLILPPVGQDESYLADLAHTNPLNRYGSAADVADATLFLLHSTFITGQILFVDGGRHMKGQFYD